MSTTISSEVEDTIRGAFFLAAQQEFTVITTEQLLLALLDNVSAREVLDACNAWTGVMRVSLMKHIQENTPSVKEENSPIFGPSTPFEIVLQRAIMYAGETEKQVVTGALMLKAVFKEEGSYALQVLSDQGVTLYDVDNFIIYGTLKKKRNVSTLTFTVPHTKEGTVMPIFSELVVIIEDFLKSKGLNALPSNDFTASKEYPHSDFSVKR